MPMPTENEYTLLDKLFAAKERVQLELGWGCNNWMEAEAKESGADPRARGTLTAALTILSDRYRDAFSSLYSARKNIGDWMRVTRFFTRDLVEELPGIFTYHHLRKCYVGGTFPDADADATMKNVRECIEYAMKNGGRWSPVNDDTGERDQKDMWRRIVAMCSSYVEHPEAKPYQIEAIQNIIHADSRHEAQIIKELGF